MGIMNATNLLLKAYYEALYELLEANRDSLAKRVDELIVEEIDLRGYDDFDDEKFAAYKDACLAFIDERIEAYNPIGIQYTFARFGSKEAFELELKLNWFDSRAEFRNLVEAAKDLSDDSLTDRQLKHLAAELTKQAGAFPDKSIIETYETTPTLRGLPDYIVAKSIEEIITYNEHKE